MVARAVDASWPRTFAIVQWISVISTVAVEVAVATPPDVFAAVAVSTSATLPLLPSTFAENVQVYAAAGAIDPPAAHVLAPRRVRSP